LKSKRSLIEKYAARGSVLDYGCGTGEFLAVLQQNSWEICGVEPSQIARDKATSTTGTPICETINQVQKGNIDVITLWHVLEHISDITTKVRELLHKLAANGTLFLAVPNHQSPDAMKYRQHWAGYDVPRHLWHFSRTSMEQLISKAGARIVQIIPMKLDAFYVSILSEKYKSENNLTIPGLVRGIMNGLNSNFGAGADNYSSLIYIVKKS
jgi:2-polyprenyl-3-methyl-5-hydroxy-6-metoxy-1,4-benzoquinol methylase